MGLGARPCSPRFCFNPISFSPPQLRRHDLTDGLGGTTTRRENKGGGKWWGYDYAYHQSASTPYFSPRKSSGAMYSAVPRIVLHPEPPILRAVLKSVRRAWPSESSRMFSGLTSGQTIESSCRGARGLGGVSERRWGGGGRQERGGGR
jgi:hypothetical protein